MKFNGKSLSALATQEIVLPRPEGQEPVSILVRARTLDGSRPSILFPDPVPPDRFRTDAKGTILRDPKTDKPIVEKDYDDHRFNAQCEYVDRMRGFVVFLDAIQADDRITFECGPHDGTPGWYEKAAKEVAAAGISQGDMILVSQLSSKLSNTDEGAPERAAEAFSSRFRPTTAE